MQNTSQLFCFCGFVPKWPLPSWILQKVSLYNWRHWAVVVAHSDIRPPHLVLWCNLLEMLQDLILACRNRNHNWHHIYLRKRCIKQLYPYIFWTNHSNKWAVTSYSIRFTVKMEWKGNDTKQLCVLHVTVPCSVWTVYNISVSVECTSICASYFYLL